MTKKVNLMTDANSIVSTVNEAVSQRIKLYRKQKKISLDELSRRAGVSKGALVEIEGAGRIPALPCYAAWLPQWEFRWLTLWMSVQNQRFISLLKMRSQNCGKVKKAGEQGCSQDLVALI
jgi:DNA-binding XRE family transcriptional regulator